MVFPDFPGCVTQGDTPQQAMENAIEALSLHVEGMVAEGLALPPTSPMNAPLPEWLSESDMPTQVHALLPTEVPGKNARVNVTLEQALLDRLDEAVRREGTTRSGYLAQAVRKSCSAAVRWRELDFIEKSCRITVVPGGGRSPHCGRSHVLDRG